MRYTYLVLRDAVYAFSEDDGNALAGHVAFSTLMGIFPFVILASNVGAILFGVNRGAEAVDQLFTYAPEHVARTLEPVLRGVLEGSGGGVLTLSALAALWFSSNAFEALRTGFDRAYQGARYAWWTGRLISLLCVVVTIIVSLVLGGTIVLAPLIFSIVESRLDILVPPGAGVARYVLGTAVFIVYMLFLHRILPRHKARVSELLPGVVATSVIWIFAASAFSVYIGLTPSYSSTYGALAGVAITLMFFYITAISVLFGAALNAVLLGRQKGM